MDQTVKNWKFCLLVVLGLCACPSFAHHKLEKRDPAGTIPPCLLVWI